MTGKQKKREEKKKHGSLFEKRIFSGKIKGSMRVSKASESSSKVLYVLVYRCENVLAISCSHFLAASAEASYLYSQSWNMVFPMRFGLLG